MCVVSAVLEYGQRSWPIKDRQEYDYQQIQPLIQPRPQISPEDWKKFLELIEKAKEFDKLTNQPDCEDPKKVEWMKQMEQRIRKLEEAQSVDRDGLPK